MPHTVTEPSRNEHAPVSYTHLDVYKRQVEKGSVTIDGISLTVAQTDTVSFSVSVIPHTLRVTVLGERRVGDSVNLETDIIAKYLEKLVHPAAGYTQKAQQSTVTAEYLSRHGF